MTVQQIITQVSNLLSGQVAEEELYAYFNEIELIIQTEYLGASRLDAVQYTVGEGDCEPIVTGQYERMYSYWLLSRGHFKLHNETQADRFRKLFRSESAAFRRWLIRTHGKGDAMHRGHGVFLSAYGIACKHGFVGSEQEWLESLHGRDGADGANGIIGRDGVDGAPGEKGEKGDKGDPGEPGPQGEQGPQGEPGRDGVDGKDGADAAQYDLQYDAKTHILQLLCNGVVVRSFDLTQSTDIEELSGILDVDGCYLLDSEGAYILPAEAQE